jgi:hypothetical protein
MNNSLGQDEEHNSKEWNGQVTIPPCFKERLKHSRRKGSTSQAHTTFSFSTSSSLSGLNMAKHSVAKQIAVRALVLVAT